MKINRKPELLKIINTLFPYLYWGFLLWYVYRNILFRCFPTLLLKESRIILLCMIVSSSIIGLFIDRFKNTSGLSPSVNLIIGFGLYTVVTYISIRPPLIVITLIVTVLIMFAYSVRFILQGRNKWPNKSNRRLFRAVRDVKTILSLGLGVIMLVLGITVLAGGYLFRPTISAAKAEDASEWTIDNKIMTLSLFFDDEQWDAASLEEKLDACQTLANIYQVRWGINELNVVASNTSENLLGGYKDGEHMIILGMDHLLYDPGPDVCNTVIHEAYHAFERRMVDVYNEVDDDLKDMYIFEDAAIYKQEFEHYISSDSKDHSAYYDQQCEKAARAYAQAEVYLLHQHVVENLGYVT